MARLLHEESRASRCYKKPWMELRPGRHEGWRGWPDMPAGRKPGEEGHCRKGRSVGKSHACSASKLPHTIRGLPWTSKNAGGPKLRAEHGMWLLKNTVHTRPLASRYHWYLHLQRQDFRVRA